MGKLELVYVKKTKPDQQIAMILELIKVLQTRKSRIDRLIEKLKARQASVASELSAEGATKF